MPKFNRLRKLGPFGSLLANILSIITANWALAMSAILGVVTALTGWLREIALNPATYAGVGTFLAMLWTIIGILFLIDRRRPRAVRSHTDYSYGLTFEGFIPRYSTNEDFGSPGLHFAINIRNYNQSPIHYEYEEVDIRLGTRALQRIKPGALSGFMARGAGRTSSIKGFSQKDLTEFFDAGQVQGVAEFAIVYGPPVGRPERRLKVEIEFIIFLTKNNNNMGWQDNIISESDEPY